MPAETPFLPFRDPDLLEAFAPEVGVLSANGYTEMIGSHSRFKESCHDNGRKVFAPT